MGVDGATSDSSFCVCASSATSTFSGSFFFTINGGEGLRAALFGVLRGREGGEGDLLLFFALDLSFEGGEGEERSK